MAQEFMYYLSKFAVKRGELHTHTSMGRVKATYYVDDNNQSIFLQKYSTAIADGELLCITEKPGVYAPLRIDFDMRSSIEDGCRRMYTHDDVKLIIQWIQALLRSSIDEEEFEEKYLYCILLEKPAPRSDTGVIKDGFHLHFPHFFCEGWFQDDFVRNHLNEKIKEGHVFRNSSYLTPLTELIDKNIAGKVWLMYGSAKNDNEGTQPYLVTKCYNDLAEECDLDIIFKEEMIGRQKNTRFYLPTFLSVRDWLKATLLKEAVANKKNAKVVKKRKKILTRKRDDVAIYEDLKTITDGKIMDMISLNRAENYDHWIDVGWTLYNIGEGCEDALNLWIDFSRKSSKFISGECEEAWAKMELKGKTIASLLAMAKVDSPNEYNMWKSTQVNYHLNNALQTDKPNEHDVSTIVHHLYKDKFVCADAKKDIWYEFKQHRWHLLDDGISLKKLFCNEIRAFFYAYKEDIVRRQRETENEVEKARLEVQELRCLKMTTALKEVSFHEKVMKMCKIFFHDATFLKMMDENRLLFGCNNGVIDLGMRIFREGRPDDYITLCSNVDYNPYYNNDDDEVQEVHDFLRKIFPDKALYEYFLDVICACLEGGNTSKIFVVHTGPPDGGKSLTMSFVEKTFGEYYIKFPRELFIAGGKNSSSGARPEMARTRGRRIGAGQEVTDNENFNNGVIKELTGNDSYFSRNLFEKGAEIKPQFTLMMQCNKPPKVPGDDDAVWARTRLLPYKSKFVKPRELEKFPVPETEAERIAMKRWKADPSLGDRLDELVSAFLWILFTRYPEYKTRGLRDPPEVQTATQAYRAENDIFMQYKKDRVSYEPGEFLRLTDVVNDFNDWFRESFSTREKKSRLVISTELSRKLETPLAKKGTANGWHNFKIMTEDLKDEDAQALQRALVN